MDGTPTVIIVGRHRRPVLSSVTAVLSKGMRESQASQNGSGPYWQSIVHHIDDKEFDNEWIGVAQLARDALSKHPWSLTGGGALDVIAVMEQSAHNVGRSGGVHRDHKFHT